ncbi:hypothetical protein LOQ52_10730 [Staphylococcus aureus]
MRIIGIKDEFFNQKFKKIIDEENCEIQYNKNGKRPYFLGVNLNNKIILIPFRSNAKNTPDEYKIELIKNNSKKQPALDITKLLIFDKALINKNVYNIRINKDVYLYLRSKESIIKEKTKSFINEYINIKALKPNDTYSRTTRYTSLKYFHKELNLDENINNKRKEMLINEIEQSGVTLKFKKLSQFFPNVNNLIELRGYKNLCQYDSFIDPESDLQNPKLIIRMKDKNFKSISLNTINHLVETNNVSKLNDYFLLSKKHTAINKYNKEI